MQFVLPIIAIIILGVAEVSMNITPTPTPQKTTEEKVEEKEKLEPTKTEEVKSETTTSSVKIIITSTPTKESSEKPSSSNYIYPNATVLSQSENEIHLETSDSTQSVTDWYKNYISENNMNTTSFVTTNTNDNILNRLAGSGNGQKIDVEIQKNSGESTTKVKIILNS